MLIIKKILTKFELIQIAQNMTSSSQSSHGIKNAKISAQLLEYYLNLDNEYALEEVPVTFKNFLLPYIKHVQSIKNTAYCLDHLFEMNKSTLAIRTLSQKFNDVMKTLKNDLDKLTADVINHLTDNSEVTILENGDPSFLGLSNEFCLNHGFQTTSINDSSTSNKRKQDNVESEIKRSKVQLDSETNSSSSGSGTLNRNLQFNEEGLLLVFVDGACLSNGRVNAQAGYGVWFNFEHPLNVSAPVKGIPTNNNAEIQAATHAIQIAYNIGIKKIKLHTDSKFLINCMTSWIHKWKINNWMTVTQQPVKNKESLLELDGIIPLMEKVEWVYVEAHKGLVGNEAADALAKKGAAKYKL